MSDRDARRKLVLEELNRAVAGHGVEVFPAAADRVLDALDRLDLEERTEARP